MLDEDFTLWISDEDLEKFKLKVKKMTTKSLSQLMNLIVDTRLVTLNNGFGDFFKNLQIIYSIVDKELKSRKRS